MLVREYDPARDREAVRECFESGFRHGMWPLFDYSETRAIDDMIEVDLRSASDCLVAEVDGVARGVLIGKTRQRALRAVREYGLLAGFIWRRWVSDRGAMRPFARANLRRELFAEVQYQLHSPRGKGARGRTAEVYDLASVEGYRGGIGTALMDEFARRAKAAGARRIELGTDSELAWRFYEKYGFRRVSEFPLHLYDYSLPDRDVTGYIYVLDIANG